jgi:hypothetical protein
VSHAARCRLQKGGVLLYLHNQAMALGLALLVVGALSLVRLRHDGGIYRAGPWPGLTARGAAVLLACAALLAGLQVMVGAPQQAWPDLTVHAVTAFIPLVLATRWLKMPGAASAACGAYLLPRSLISLIQPSLEPPPLLLVGAVAFDLTLWLHRADLAKVWPRGGQRWRKRFRLVRKITLWRSVLGGAIFGLTFSLVQPAFELLLGGDPTRWSANELYGSMALAIIGCGAVGVFTKGEPGTGPPLIATPR